MSGVGVADGAALSSRGIVCCSPRTHEGSCRDALSTIKPSPGDFATIEAGDTPGAGELLCMPLWSDRNRLNEEHGCKAHQTSQTCPRCLRQRHVCCVVKDKYVSGSCTKGLKGGQRATAQAAVQECSSPLAFAKSARARRQFWPATWARGRFFPCLESLKMQHKLCLSSTEDPSQMV